MQQTRLNPYIGFKDKAKPAMEFYHSVFGGKLTLNNFKDSKASVDPSEDELIMHGMLEAENGMVLMASDTPKHMEYNPAKGISISLSGDNEEELKGYWDKLTSGGTISIPLSKAPWGDSFGMVRDQFGVQWMVNITGKKE